MRVSLGKKQSGLSVAFFAPLWYQSRSVARQTVHRPSEKKSTSSSSRRRQLGALEERRRRQRIARVRRPASRSVRSSERMQTDGRTDRGRAAHARTHSGGRAAGSMLLLLLQRTNERTRRAVDHQQLERRWRGGIGRRQAEQGEGGQLGGCWIWRRMAVGQHPAAAAASKPSKRASKAAATAATSELREPS